jgi:hypothetical protein
MSSLESALDTLKVWTLDENDTECNLNSLRGGAKAMVLDFWTTKCVKCPAALEKLNDEAEGVDDVIYVSCALSQGEGNKEMVRDLVGDWENMTHVFMDMENKEAAKAAFGFAQVPFYVVVSKEGNILGKGAPQSVDHQALLQSDAATLKTATTVEQAPVDTNIFTLEEDF